MTEFNEPHRWQHQIKCWIQANCHISHTHTAFNSNACILFPLWSTKKHIIYTNAHTHTKTNRLPTIQQQMNADSFFSLCLIWNWLCANIMFNVQNSKILFFHYDENAQRGVKNLNILWIFRCYYSICFSIVFVCVFALSILVPMGIREGKQINRLMNFSNHTIHIKKCCSKNLI